jgi:integrase
MRHSAGSYMDHMGVPHEQIAEILGHAGTRTTEEVYINSWELHQTGGKPQVARSERRLLGLPELPVLAA